MKPKKELETTNNSTVDDRLRRKLFLSCPHCKPHRNENCKRHAKHGKTKARYKTRKKD